MEKKEVERLVKDLVVARKNKDFAESDRIRKLLESKDLEVSGDARGGIFLHSMECGVELLEFRNGWFRYTFVGEELFV